MKYYKISVLNEMDGNFYVAACSLTKRWAERKTDELIGKGLIARFSPHIMPKKKSGGANGKKEPLRDVR